jgi:hypothetical protein
VRRLTSNGSELLDRRADIVTVAKLAGHASVTTTARYDRRDEEAGAPGCCISHSEVANNAGGDLEIILTEIE